MRSVCCIVSLLIVASAQRDSVAAGEIADRDEPVKQSSTPTSAAKITQIDKDSFTVRTKDGSHYRIPVSRILAYRQRNGNTEVKLTNGRVLVIASESRTSNDTDWQAVRRTEAAAPRAVPPTRGPSSLQPQSQAARRYGRIAADLQHLIDTARPAMESTSDAADVRTVSFGLRELNKAIKAKRWNAAGARVRQMKAALERVRKIARAAPKRLAQRERKSAEREKAMERLRIEIDMLSDLSVVGPMLSDDVGILAEQLAVHARRSRELRKKREQRQRELRKLEDEERREKERYEKLMRLSKV